MKKSDFYYDLPEELIAQRPVEPRTASRLLVLHKDTGRWEDRRFTDLAGYLNPGDCLVLNDTRVLPARLYGTARDTGARVEFLLLKDLGGGVWECLAGPGKKAKPGRSFTFGEGLDGRVESVLEGGNRAVRFFCEGDFYAALDRLGEMPLPHYIKEPVADGERYQTVYARERGSAAAPTAGLHFTKEYLDIIRAKGVNIAYVTLHVGLGTFRPVKEEDVTRHVMHSEHYSVPPETANIINATKAAGGHVVCVGTTVCRTLESVAAGGIRECSGETDIFIYPGYRLLCTDALLTNFHLPESTLIMLVSAFAGRENTLAAYRHAVEEKYRFYSFGDAMLII